MKVSGPEGAAAFLARNRWMAMGTVTVLIGLAILFGVSMLIQARQPLPADRPLALPPPPPIDLADVVTVLSVDSIPAIDEPQFDTVEQAAAFMQDDERLIGVVINGEARAYPIPILSAHEIVNDVVGGEPVAITWCPLCFSALVFSRRVPGRAAPLRFGVSGKLLHNTLVMVDRQSGALWSQLYGAALDGEMAGVTLSVFPSVLTEWRAWRAQYPHSLVLSKSQTCAQFGCGPSEYAVDPYTSYYQSPLEGLVDRQIPRQDVASGGKQRVLGVRVGSQARAYPFGVLESEHLIHDELNGVPLLVWFDLQTQSGMVYERRAVGVVLTFEPDPAGTGLLRDLQTGSLWQMATGEAVAGPLQGERLAGVVATPAFEFGWQAYFPHSTTYP